MGYTSFSNLPLSAYNELSSKVEDRVYFINDEGTIRLNEVTYGAGGGGSDSTDYLTLRAEQANSTVALNKSADNASLSAVLEYSTDGETWNNYTWNGTSGLVITLANVGDFVKFRGDNKTFTINNNNYYKFAMTGSISAFGNVNTLLNKDGNASLTTFCFGHLFQVGDSLISIDGIELPATILAASCYYSMFSTCRKLTSIPKLPATTLAASCYERMFEGCPGLEIVKLHIEDNFTNSIPANAYSRMFNCSAYEYSSKLRKVELEFNSHSPATDSQSFSNMFAWNRKLSEIKVNLTNWISCQDWLSNVAASGTFYCPYGLDTSIRDGSHIPVGWNVVYTDVPESVLSGISATEAALTMN